MTRGPQSANEVSLENSKYAHSIGVPFISTLDVLSISSMPHKIATRS
jgi:hypothetical protein